MQIDSKNIFYTFKTSPYEISQLTSQDGKKEKLIINNSIIITSWEIKFQQKRRAA